MADEILKDAELDKVVGGSGIECMGLLSRLQQEGLYTPKTPLVVGNERAAAAELKAYLGTFTQPFGDPYFDTSKIYADDRPNQYILSNTFVENPGDEVLKNVDALIAEIKAYNESHC